MGGATGGGNGPASAKAGARAAIHNDAGIGLGLALSKGFVEGMGGTLEAEDTPGGGPTMVVTLPAAEGTGS